jgi:hypothetical protein
MRGNFYGLALCAMLFAFGPGAEAQQANESPADRISIAGQCR